VREHVQRGGAAIAVLHEITMALHADEMVVMDAGGIVHQGACLDTTTHRALEDVFAGRVRVREIDGRPVALPNETAAHS
jgi:iron complex transport system ATP-binding protein